MAQSMPQRRAQRPVAAGFINTANYGHLLNLLLAKTKIYKITDYYGQL